MSFYIAEGEELLSILTSITKFFEPKSIADPLFGIIKYQRAGFWEGHKLFAPTGQQVKILIDGSEYGPTEKQREFYRELEQRYPKLANTTGDLLHETFTNWKEEFPRENIWREFELVVISIPKVRLGQIEWELSYACASDDHSFDVQMSGWEPSGLAING